MTEVLTLLRAVNCPLLTVAVLLLVIRLADLWPTFRFGMRVAFHGLVLLVISGVVGSAIKYLNHVPVDPSVALVTASGCLVLAGLAIETWIARHSRRRKR